MPTTQGGLSNRARVISEEYGVDVKKKGQKRYYRIDMLKLAADQYKIKYNHLPAVTSCSC